MSADAPKKAVIYVSLDIEGAGAPFDAPIVAIGCVVANEAGDILDKQCWCIKVTEDQIEPRCKEEFWDKNKELWERIQAQAQPEEQAAKSFVAHWNALEKLYPSDTHSIVILSDNPAYDVSRIDYFVWKHTKRLPIRYTTAGKYRSIEDPSEQVKGTNDQEGCEARANAKCKNTHWPVEDAEHILHLHQEVKRLKKSAA